MWMKMGADEPWAADVPRRSLDADLRKSLSIRRIQLYHRFTNCESLARRLRYGYCTGQWHPPRKAPPSVSGTVGTKSVILRRMLIVDDCSWARYVYVMNYCL